VAAVLWNSGANNALRLLPNSTRAGHMATPPPLFRTTPPPTPPRVASPASAPAPGDAAEAARPHPSSPMPAGSDTVGADGCSPPAPAEGPAAAAVMPEAADTEPAAAEPQRPRSGTRDDSPAYTPRVRYGPRAPTISKSQLQRGLRSICTLCKRSQRVSSNVAMCPSGCPCPWAVRPAAQPGWGWQWIPQGDRGFYSRTEERRAHRRMCFVCRCAASVGSEHVTCPPWCPCPWASPTEIRIPPDEKGREQTVNWEGHQRRLAQQREAEVEAARAKPPRWERRLALPNAEGRREEHWVNLNLPQPPLWWEPKALGRLPLPRDK